MFKLGINLYINKGAGQRGLLKLPGKNCEAVAMTGTINKHDDVIE